VSYALEKFDGTCAPIDAVDWLSSVVDKLESFQFLLQIGFVMLISY
jgi:hypothetical protein